MFCLLSIPAVPYLNMTSESPWGLSHKELSHYFAFYHEIVPEGELLSGKFSL